MTEIKRGVETLKWGLGQPHTASYEKHTRKECEYEKN